MLQSQMSQSEFLQLVNSIDDAEYAGAFIEVNGEVTHEFI